MFIILLSFAVYSEIRRSRDIVLATWYVCILINSYLIFSAAYISTKQHDGTGCSLCLDRHGHGTFKMTWLVFRATEHCHCHLLCASLSMQNTFHKAH
eukprot:6180523-Pleurochrysis_carterae.AAC.3